MNMKRQQKALGLAAIALVLTACAHSEPSPNGVVGKAVPPPVPPPSAAPVSTAEDFRREPPAPGAKIPFVPPEILEERLENGVLVRVTPRAELPIVAVQIAFNRGASEARPGVGSFFGSMLLSGTKTKSSAALSEAFQALGARFGASVDMDGSAVTGQVLTTHLPALLDLLAEVIQSPALDAKEIERERRRRLTSLQQENDSPGRLLNRKVGEALYPKGHPYASTLLGDEASLKATTRPDLLRFHNDVFAPDAMTIAFAGDITKERAVAEARRVFGRWRGKAKVAVPPKDPAFDAKAPRLVIVDRPGAPQSNVAVALVGVPRLSPDYDAIRVMNTILGGQFSSRLNLNLREKNAYTYGARSGFDMRHGAGPFTAGAAIQTAKTEPGVREILAEMARIRDELVPEQELRDAKVYLIDQLPARFESTAAMASTAADLAVYGLPKDEIATLPARLERVTQADVQRVAQKYLVADKLCIIVVGDASVVQKGLETLGVGPAELVSPPAAKK